MRKVMMLSALALAGAVALACGDDDDDKNSGGANMCGVGADVDVPGCSKAQVEKYTACMENACQSKYQECFGPKYKSGEFGGVCADYMECVTACDCDDNACRQACTASSACTQCQLGFASCAGSCTNEILSCAGGDLGDSGLSLSDGSINFGDSSFDLRDAGIQFNDGAINFNDATIKFDKTCADLKSCCDSLTDSRKQTCDSIYGTVSSQGDFVCSAAVSQFCP